MNGKEQLGFIAGFPGCGVQQWEHNKDRWQWINSSCNVASAGCSAVLVPAQQQPQACPAAGKCSLFLCRVRDNGDGEKQRVCSEQHTPILVLCSKHAEKSKEIQVGFPLNISAPFRLMVLIPWLIFRLKTSKLKKKK